MVPARENIFLFPDTIILTRETEGQIDRGPPYGINHYTDRQFYPPPFLPQTSHSIKNWISDTTNTKQLTQEA